MGKSREKYIGLVGRHDWTDKSYINVEYRPLEGANAGQFVKVVTVHVDFDSVEEVSALWDRVLEEMEAGLYGNSQFMNNCLYYGICPCIANHNIAQHKWDAWHKSLSDTEREALRVQVSQDKYEALHRETVNHLYGYRIDGWGRMRRK